MQEVQFVCEIEHVSQPVAHFSHFESMRMYPFPQSETHSVFLRYPIKHEVHIDVVFMHVEQLSVHDLHSLLIAMYPLPQSVTHLDSFKL